MAQHFTVQLAQYSELNYVFAHTHTNSHLLALQNISKPTKD